MPSFCRFMSFLFAAVVVVLKLFILLAPLVVHFGGALCSGRLELPLSYGADYASQMDYVF